jgi:TolB-like protein/Flp pilus assembly protein TadD
MEREYIGRAKKPKMTRENSVKKVCQFYTILYMGVLGTPSMNSKSAIYTLCLTGPFRLNSPAARRIEIASKKGQALIAMLAMAGGGERTRSWLQGQLWGSRQPDQAQASLRAELSNLRKILNDDGHILLYADHSRIWLDVNMIEVVAQNSNGIAAVNGEFLEGLDIPHEEGFEDWLRNQRANAHNQETAKFTNSPQATQSSVDHNEEDSNFASMPALAILPFQNLTGDNDQDFLAEGLSEDLIDRLSRLRWLPIIARSSSFAEDVNNVDPRGIGKKLGARYLLEGRIRHLRGALHLSASLCDCETGQTLWTQKSSLEALDQADSFSDLVLGLTNILGAKIDQEEQVRALRKPQSDLNVRDLIWRGRWHLNRFTKSDSDLAAECFTKALDIEPNSPEALIQYTWSKLLDLWTQRATDDEKMTLRRMAQKAIIADYDDARGHMLAGIAEIWLMQPLRAEALLRRATDLNPSLVMAHAQLGTALNLRGEHHDAIEALRYAVRLSPNDHDLFYTSGELASAHLMTGDYDAAIKHADLSISRRSAYWLAHVVKIGALAKAGQQKSAKRAYVDLLQVKPDFTNEFVDWIPYLDRSKNLFLKEGLNLSAA